MPNEIQDPEDVVGLCTECGSEQPMTYMERNPFTAQGSSAPCRFCGGVTTITFREAAQEALRQSNRERGL